MKKSTSRSQRVERTDLYQQVTDRIVAALEKGVPPGASRGARWRNMPPARFRLMPRRGSLQRR